MYAAELIAVKWKLPRGRTRVSSHLEGRTRRSRRALVLRYQRPISPANENAHCEFK